MKPDRALIVFALLALVLWPAYAAGHRVAVAQETPSTPQPRPWVSGMPLPASVATPSPLFADKSYFYRGEENDPKKHPIPPEVDIGIRRDPRMWCLDWSRLRRTSHDDTWEYFVTTCQCLPSFAFPPRSSAPRP